MHPNTSHSPIENRLLAALPDKEYQRLLPHLELVTFKLKDVLYKPGEMVSDVYFPNESIVSLVSVMKDGHSVEVGLVGREGMVSTAAFMGSGISPNEAMVQGMNGAMKMKANILKEEFKRGGELQDILLRYAHLLYMQASQIAACNRLHSIEKRLARWLLMMSDRLRSEKMILTQEFLAVMLGTERSGVTIAAITLQDEELITYSRGKITILDCAGLEAAACECYPVIKHAFDHFLDK